MTEQLEYAEYKTRFEDYIDSPVRIEFPLASNSKLNALIQFRGQDLPVLCLLPSAQTKNHRKNPYFYRESWIEDFPESNIIIISDPSLDLDENLLAGWFIHPKVDLSKLVASAIGELLEFWGATSENLLFYGSAMGGFIGIQLSTLIEGSHCIAEVPELDVTSYQFPEALEILEKSILQGSFVRHRRIYPEQVSVLARMKKESRVPNLSIITNQDDPYFNEVISLAVDSGKLESTSRGHLRIDISPQSIGHKPLPTDETQGKLKLYLNQIHSITHFVKPQEALPELLAETETSVPGEINELLIHELTDQERESFNSMSFAELRNLATERIASVELTRDEADKAKYVSALKSLQGVAEKDPSLDWPYLRAAALEKGWNLSFRGRILDLANAAWNRNRTIDALVYQCRGILAEVSLENAEVKFRTLKSEISDQDQLTIVEIFESILHYEQDKYTLFEADVRRIREALNPEFETYLLIPFSTVVLEEDTITAADTQTAEELDKVSKSIAPEQALSGVDYNIVASCDSVYLAAFGKFLVESFEISCSDEARLTLIVLGNENHLRETTQSLRAISPRVQFIFLDLTAEENVGPTSSLIRFIPVNELLRSTGKPVVVMDIDALITSDFGPEFDASHRTDIALRQLGDRVAPWEKYAAGFVIFYPTEAGKSIAENINIAARSILRPGKPQWWIDQSALEYGIRSWTMKNSAKPVITNLIKDSERNLFLPTGPRTTKVKLLEREIAKLKASYIEST
ncbi:hypothetical protein [Corynebacterium lubricantis]|uniref:hypothetical protein n=1 Tax=Corynebacterium lubricantis TaxID=541095 RepID=UPI000365C62C|nr:hypothetical protein [Corynebacterium lubricantis]